MKKHSKFSLLSCIILFTAISANAQYETGIGATLGMYGRGLTVIQYLAPGSRGAADFLLTSQYKGIVFTGLFEIHNPNHDERIELANVGFFAGIGAHGGIINRLQYNTDPPTDLNKEKIFVVGMDLIAGAEWKLPRVPLLLSINVKPYLDLNYIKIQPDWFDAAITLRLLF